MTNLFSSFDPGIFFFFISMNLNWMSLIFILLILFQGFWLLSNQYLYFKNLIIEFLMKELTSIFPKFVDKMVYMNIMSLFLFFILSNQVGLLPYVFTNSSHIQIALGFSLSFYLGHMMMNLFYQFNSVMSHLVPLGTPFVLMPLMVMIESVSNIIRPWTLAIRITANMMAGHLLLTLLGSNMSLGFSLAFFLVFTGLFFLVILELAVASIQAYVFTILSSLYISELSSLNMSKL